MRKFFLHLLARSWRVNQFVVKIHRFQVGRNPTSCRTQCPDSGHFPSEPGHNVPIIGRKGEIIPNFENIHKATACGSPMSSVETKNLPLASKLYIIPTRERPGTPSTWRFQAIDGNQRESANLAGGHKSSLPLSSQVFLPRVQLHPPPAHLFFRDSPVPISRL